MVTIEEVQNAYRRLKSYYYYDNSLLFQRNKILKFEDENFEHKIHSLAGSLIFHEQSQEYFQNLINEIDFIAIPKHVDAQKATKESNSNFYINRVYANSDIDIKKVNLFIDCPVELHIICVLFLEKIGPLLEERINRKNFGNRLEIDPQTKKIKNGYKLFKPYFDQYKNWRDLCIKISKESLDSNNNVAILNIDLKSFYYSCNFSFTSLLSFSSYPFDQFLILTLSNIHDKYNSLIGAKYKSLPIGLLTSGVLANYYLTKFDNTIMDQLNPIYYGRYVDDILLAINVNIIPYEFKTKDPIEDFFEKHFIPNIFKQSQNHSGEKIYRLELADYRDAEITIQNSKILLHYFDHTGSSALLDKIIDEINRNSSEFRFLPEDSKIFSFDDSSHSLIYKDSSNSIRNIQEYSVNKFEISKYFARLNMLSGLTNKKEKIPEKTFLEIKNFFRCGSAIELFGFWEKSFTAYVLNEKPESLIELIKQIIDAINLTNIKLSSNEDLYDTTRVTKEKVISFLLEHLKNSIAQAIALNIQLLKKNNKLATFLEDRNWKEISQNSALIIRGHYIRHHLLLYPIFNFLTPITESEFDYTSKNLNYYLDNINKLNISGFQNEWSIKSYPRFIHYHEIQTMFLLVEIVRIARANGTKSIKSCMLTTRTNQAFLKFNHINDPDYKLPDATVNKIKSNAIDGSSDETIIYQHKVDLEPFRLALIKKFGIVNLRIQEEKILNNILYGNDLTFKEFFKFAKIINEANFENCDYTIFPECSVPVTWLPLFINESRKKSMSFILGLEHFEFLGVVFNITANLLEFKTKEHSNTYVNLRIKNIPSHEEKRYIEGHSKAVAGNVIALTTAQPKRPVYDLIQHDKTYFTIFNCFELSDISSRSHFKSHVDFLVAVENNKDTNYFSSVVDSTSRDLHSYVIQVNNSLWGDSRITKPAKSENKDVVKVKGGKNVYLVTEDLNILSLRRFQRLSYDLQRESKEFKPTPPRYKLLVKRKTE